MLIPSSLLTAVSLSIVLLVPLAQADSHNIDHDSSDHQAADNNDTSEQTSSTLPATTLQPGLRALPRDWAYFADIPCKDVAALALESAQEQQWLEQRQRQCEQERLEKYRAFLPSAVNPR